MLVSEFRAEVSAGAAPDADDDGARADPDGVRDAGRLGRQPSLRTSKDQHSERGDAWVHHAAFGRDRIYWRLNRTRWLHAGFAHSLGPTGRLSAVFSEPKNGGFALTMAPRGQGDAVVLGWPPAGQRGSADPSCADRAVLRSCTGPGCGFPRMTERAIRRKDDVMCMGTVGPSIKRRPGGRSVTPQPSTGEAG